jgi:hypothetical protein
MRLADPAGVVAGALGWNETPGTAPRGILARVFSGEESRMHTATVLARFTAAFLLFWLGACGGDQGQPEPGAGVVPGTAVAHRGGDRAGREPVWTTRVDTVGRGDTFGSLLLRNDVHVEEAGRIVRFVRERTLFSLRRLQPGEPVRVRCRSDGRFQALQYEKGPDEVYVVERDGNSLIGYRTAIAYDLHLRKIEGTVETTGWRGRSRAAPPPRH